MRQIRCGWVAMVVLPSALLAGSPPPVEVTVDASQVPALEPWCDEAAAELTAWHPRITNLLAGEGFVPPHAIGLAIKKSDQGVGGTAGTTITVHSGWISRHPEDIGLVIHELVHVIQRYPSPHPGWVTEGIADYLRWAIYEGKPQSWFPVPGEPTGYTRGYQAAAGFLLWLESGPAPGIVRTLNHAMRTRTYEDRLFEERARHSLPDLWARYQEARRSRP